MINVQANGRSYTEMHVDGSVAAQVFVYWAGVRLNDIAAANGAQRERKIYVLRNARLDPEWSLVKRQTLSITFKAIAGLLEYQGLDDLYRIFAVCQRDGTDSTWLTFRRPLRNRKGRTLIGSTCRSYTTSALRTRSLGIIGRNNLQCW